MKTPVKIVELQVGSGLSGKYIVVITDGKKGRDAMIYDATDCGEIKFTYTLKEFLKITEQWEIDELELINGFDFATLDWRA